jgi:NADH:ubiquinone oxidoreductase subunit F (NADH-binding)
MDELLQKLYYGRGTQEDLRVLKSIAGQIGGRTLCALGDFAVNPVLSTVRHFPEEYEAKVKAAAANGQVVGKEQLVVAGKP